MTILTPTQIVACHGVGWRLVTEQQTDFLAEFAAVLMQISQQERHKALGDLRRVVNQIFYERDLCEIPL